MLRHLSQTAENPARAVVLGAAGFIGGAVARKFSDAAVPVLGLGRKELDLNAADAGDRLAALLRPDDTLVIVSARAPCKTPAMMLENIQMMAAVCAALAQKPVAHAIYMSSDAVYADGPLPLTENSPAAPGSLHGAMHVAREQMLLAAAGTVPVALLRPTLVYGAGDPHNGYGPNRFRRLAAKREDIVLFGAGEERRDHVWIEDVAEIVVRVLLRRSTGVLNVASGAVHSFRAIADLVVSGSPHRVAIKDTPRSGPMPHNGYRPFDVTGTRVAFPDFQYTQLADGLNKVRQAESA